MYKRIAFALAALAAGAAVAQGARPDPASPRATAAPLEYRSAFEGYRPFAEEKPAPWRESNDAVKEGAGSHAGHGGHNEDSAPPPQPPTEHGGHGDHK